MVDQVWMDEYLDDVENDQYNILGISFKGNTLSGYQDTIDIRNTRIIVEFSPDTKESWAFHIFTVKDPEILNDVKVYDKMSFFRSVLNIVNQIQYR